MKRALRGAVLPAALLLLWELANRAGWVDPRILPPLERVAHTAVDQMVNQGLLGHLGSSLTPAS